MSRFWTYPRDEWEAQRWTTKLGADEYGRRTIVAPIPFAGWLVWAFYTYPCRTCALVRMQTWRNERGDFGGWPNWLIDWAFEEESK